MQKDRDPFGPQDGQGFGRDRGRGFQRGAARGGRGRGFARGTSHDRGQGFQGGFGHDRGRGFARGFAHDSGPGFQQSFSHDRGRGRVRRGEGGGYGNWRNNDRGAQSMDSLNELMQRPDGQEPWRSNRGGWRGNHPPRGNGRGNAENPDGYRRQRKYPISVEDLDKLTTLMSDLVVLELLNEKSGFSVLVDQENIPPKKLGLSVKVLAVATTSQSMKERVYELINKTCTENFVTHLMNYSLTLQRQFPDKAPEFFTQLHTVLDTYSIGMMSNAISRVTNLVYSCYSTLTLMKCEGKVEDELVNKYKTLLDRLNEAAKRWEQEKKIEKQDGKRRRQDEMDSMEPMDNFRDISVLPTIIDIDSRRPFLRRNVVKGCYTDGQHYLDVQFRLLREDFVRPLREGIWQFRSKVKSHIMDVRIYRNVTYVGSKLDRQKIFHEVRLGSMNTMRLEYSKRLMYGNLVCFSNDNFATMILGAVADRSAESLKKGIIGVEFESNISEYDMSGNFIMIESRAYFVAYKHVLQALKEMPDNIPMEKYVVQVEPLIDPPKYLTPDLIYDMRVIKNRSMMKASEALSKFFIHDDEERMQDEEVEIPACLERVQAANDYTWPSAHDLGLDTSQRRALHGALTRELAIIQGPPGTGKTFIGLKIVQTLLHNSQVWKDDKNPTPILVVCFTNHALDQFLEGMMTYTTSIVRVGSRTQSESIGKYQINKLVQGVVRARSMPQVIHSQKNDITFDLRRLEEGINLCREIDIECSAKRGIFTLDMFAAKNIIPDHILCQLQAIKYDEKMTHWLTLNHQPPNAPGYAPQAYNTTPKKQRHQQADAELENDIDENKRKDNEELLAIEEHDRMIEDDFEEPTFNASMNRVHFEITKGRLEIILGELEKILQDFNDENAYLEYIIRTGQLEAMNYGLCIPVNIQEVEGMQAQTTLNIWRLEPHRKWQMYNYWVTQLQISVKPKWATLSAKFQTQVKALEGMKNAEYLYAMRKAAVVGMTTTGAAQYNRILQDLAPAIVVIEEAAEILESHVITSLTAACKHLIMIGDHQQLQPSATVYELATKYGLETSLFERLIKNGLAFETLEYQHRMRPSISKLLVPSIYPTLKDHDSVHEYPNVLGITQNMFFITHQEAERKDSDDNSSHENQHEAEFMIGLCRHLMLQGYSPEEITILTAYSGQFFLLRKLQRTNPICTGVKICVVDNYQGEENKIILLSLVRSNPEGKVGFLRTDNRVCVALSRAKYGLYITGNMDLLSQSSTLWKNIKTDLSESGSLGNALPLQCENHPHQLSMVSTGQDFQTKSPEGGCAQMCAKPLPNCRHSCPKVCHLDDVEHKEYMCEVACPKTLCSLDHKCPKVCWQECGVCEVMLLKPLPCSHIHKIPCHMDPRSYNCPTSVVKVIPACQHEVAMPCHHDPSLFSCPEDCDTRPGCGHKCRKRCHRIKDPDHLDYLCEEMCTRTNVDCSQNHQCLKRCYQECGSCTVLVNKKLPCGHEAKGVECSQQEEDIKCQKKCKRTNPCGHACKKLCYSKCGDCNVLVKKTVLDCNHNITVQCCQAPTTDRCDGQCPKRLSCGHPCLAKCKDKCTAKCPELVLTNNKCPKGHAIKLPCHLKDKVKGEVAWAYCSEPCDKRLECEHQCSGTCGHCLHGRLHQGCNDPCNRSLVCGHVCKYPCGVSCPPCQEQCKWKCGHSICRKECGKPCQPCKEKCDWECKHSKCNKKCGEKCSRDPCVEPCPEKLKCGHECVGFCGDPCPPLCRKCDFKELTELMLMGNEEEPDARFVLLEDCGHCIEVEGLEGWLMQTDTEVGMKKCPKCRSAIYTNRRYQHLVLEAYEGVQAIKNKYYKARDAIKRKKIELILQDPEVSQNFFLTQSLTILKKIGIQNQNPRKNQNKNVRIFEQFSLEEKALYYFQAQVLKKGASILKQLEGPPPSPLLSVLKPKVVGLVAQVMAKTTTIPHQMKEEVFCELQRLTVLPAYCSFLEKSNVHNNSNMVTIKAKLEVLMNPTVKFDEELDKKVRTLLKESELYIGGLGISESEKMMILKAMQLRMGHWYKCPNGHIYCITECGGAVVESKCPECGSQIGGGGHALRNDNAVASEMDGARHPAWSQYNNMNNYDPNDI